MISITASYAKYLYEKGYIKSHRHFKCSTQGCNAPITCRSIKPESRNSPTFQDQVTSDNLHRDDCTMNPKNRESASLNKNVSKSTREFKMSGERFSELKAGMGFQASENHEAKKSSDKLEEKNNDDTVISTRSNNNQDSSNLKQYKTNEKLKTLQDHVQIFESNPEFKIISGESQKQIPVKFMFRFITSNNIYEKRNNKYPYIYYGNAYLQSINDKTKIRVQFINKIKLSENEWVCPSFFIEKKFLEEEYPNIYEQSENQNKTYFRVYTTLPLKKVVSNNSTYLNLASFDNAKTLFHTSDELKNNVYIS